LAKPEVTYDIEEFGAAGSQVECEPAPMEVPPKEEAAAAKF
jgi:hypothetical protein